ncbi:hypothetical protein BVRB_025320, partial [Beta vulgaris subsp. vulgaris]
CVDESETSLLAECPGVGQHDDKAMVEGTQLSHHTAISRADYQSITIGLEGLGRGCR